MTSTMTRKPLSGDELLHELSLITGLMPTRITGVYNANSGADMVHAQIELVKSGYRLAESTMDEGHFYRQYFVPSSGSWPHSVTLRFMADVPTVPVLALMYFKDGELHQFDRAGKTTFGTTCTQAERMVLAFTDEHPDTAWFWMPVFRGTPLAKS